MHLTIFLTRHAETVWHDENRYAGRSDVALTERGADQTQRLAAWAARAAPDAVWCSPLVRSRETAQPAADAAGVDLEVDDRLVELDFGIAEGLTSAELEDKAPDELAAFRRDPVRAFFPGGEDPVAAVERYVAVIETLRERGGAVLVVAHNTMIRLTLCHLLGLELSQYRSVFPQLDNCSLTELRLGDDGAEASLLRFNCDLGDPGGPR